MLEMDQLTEPTLMAASLKDLKVHWTLSDSTHLSHFFSLQLILFFITLPEVRMHTHTHTHTHTHAYTTQPSLNILIHYCPSAGPLIMVFPSHWHFPLSFMSLSPSGQWPLKISILPPCVKVNPCVKEKSLNILKYGVSSQVNTDPRPSSPLQPTHCLKTSPTIHRLAMS